MRIGYRRLQIGFRRLRIGYRQLIYFVIASSFILFLLYRSRSTCAILPSISMLPSDFQPICDESISERDIDPLFEQFAEGLVKVRALATRLCVVPKPPGLCRHSMLEMELLYLNIRAQRPQKVLEICSNLAFPSLFVLSALEDNGTGELWGFDVHSWSAVQNLPTFLLKRFHFQNVSFDESIIASLLEKRIFNHIIIDAAHSAVRTKWFLKGVLERHAKRVFERGFGPLRINIHDMYDVSYDNQITEGGVEVLKWLQKETFFFKTECLLMNPIHNKGIVQHLNTIRGFPTSSSTHYKGERTLSLALAPSVSLRPPILIIITPSGRSSASLVKVQQSIRFDHVKFWIIVSVCDTPVPSAFPKIIHLCSPPSIAGHGARNVAFDYMFKNDISGLVYMLDDDNAMHPHFWDILSRMDDTHFYSFDQQVPCGPIRAGNNLSLSQIDTGQFAVPFSLIGSRRWNHTSYAADGLFIMETAELYPKKHIYFSRVASYYNALKCLSRLSGEPGFSEKACSFDAYVNDTSS